MNWNGTREVACVVKRILNGDVKKKKKNNEGKNSLQKEKAHP